MHDNMFLSHLYMCVRVNLHRSSALSAGHTVHRTHYSCTPYGEMRKHFDSSTAAIEE